jgi:hypothetical protein
MDYVLMIKLFLYLIIGFFVVEMYSNKYNSHSSSDIDGCGKGMVFLFFLPALIIYSFMFKHKEEKEDTGNKIKEILAVVRIILIALILIAIIVLVSHLKHTYF